MGENTLFTAPAIRVEPQWIDYNGHLNMAYYNLIFDRCTDAFLADLGMGLDYVEKEKASVFTLNAHIAYLQEVGEGDPLRVTFRILDHDTKRLHGFQEMFHAEKGYLAATCETMSMHVDAVARKSAPFPAHALERIAAREKASGDLPWPKGAGHVIAIKRDAGAFSGKMAS